MSAVTLPSAPNHTQPLPSMAPSSRTNMWRGVLPAGTSLTQFALAWILSFDAVTTVIPGGRSPEQVLDNAAAAALVPLARRSQGAVQAIYDDLIRPLVHQRW